MEDFFNKDFLTVSGLTKQIKQTLEEEFDFVSVIGELSNFKSHFSGHWYFTLKDSEAQISCTMWKGVNNYVFFTPQDGMKVIVTGKITVYPPRGNYQIDVRSMKAAGIGELQAAFEKLKQRLAAEGLFDDEYKKDIPYSPEKIGIVTAIDGAAIKDMISVARRRFPLVKLVIAPCKVQGSGAAESIVENIKMLNEQNEVDVIIVGRGGGSLEDLWAFNEEIVARGIFNSDIPVVSAVGHEIDFTIADFAADLRAPTPSAAMEIVTPDIQDFFAFINDFSYNSKQNILQMLAESRKKVFYLLRSYGFRMPMDNIKKRYQQLDYAAFRLNNNINSLFEKKKNKLSLLGKILDAHNIEKTLKKGFALVKQNNKIIKRAAGFQKDTPARLTFFDDEILIDNKK